jgi:hypothetical protein
MGRASLAYGLIGIGLFLGFGILLNLGSGPSVAGVVFSLLLVSLPVVAGIYLLRNPARRSLELEAARGWDSELLRLAEKRDGHLTVAEVVTYGDLDREAAERQLEGLCRQGFAEHTVSDDGVIVYRFQRILAAADKRKAKGVLED